MPDTQAIHNIKVLTIKSATEDGIVEAYENFECAPVYLLDGYQSGNIWRWARPLFEKGSVENPPCGNNLFDALFVCVDMKNVGKDEFGKYDFYRRLLSFANRLKQHVQKIFIGLFNNVNNFSVGTYIKLWCVQNDMFDYIKCYDKDRRMFVSLPAKFSTKDVKGENKDLTSFVSEKLFPLSAIDEQSYKLLDETYHIPSEEEKDEFIKVLANIKANKGEYFKAYIYAYVEKLASELSVSDRESWKKNIAAYRPSLLVTAIFTALSVGNKDDLSHNVTALMEMCYSYAQGIIQLVENAYKHVVSKDSRNRAIFGFYLEKEKNLSVFVADIDNTDDRKSAAIGIVDRYNEKLPKTFLERISTISEIFEFSSEKGNSPALEQYYKKSANLAFHYGLQIFSDVIKTSGGRLEVTSGVDGREKSERNYYIASAVGAEKSSARYHLCGTEYDIKFPTVVPTISGDGSNYFLGNESIAQSDLLLDKQKVLDSVKHIRLSGSEPRKEIEKSCKTNLVELLDNDNLKALCITGFPNRYAMLDAARVISLFYDRLGNFEKIKSKGIFLYGENGGDRENRDCELYFSGASWAEVVGNLRRQSLVRYIPEEFMREINAIKRVKDNDTNGETAGDGPLPIALLKYYISPDDSGKTIIQKQLDEIINCDVHSENLGCKIADTHVRIGKVHLKTFYEAQFLFGNAYCTDVFALYLADSVNRIIERLSDKNCNKVVLYGYETYSTLTLYKAQEFLKNKCKNIVRVDTIVYESVNERVRYLGDSALFHPKKKADDSAALLVFVMGISSTLSTFKQMNVAFERALSKACAIENEKKCVKRIEKRCFSVIQIVGEDNDDSGLFIEADNDSDMSCGIPAYKSKRAYLDFIDDENAQKAYYFISARSRWYAAEINGCKLCLPSGKAENGEDAWLNERPLIEVDDTSVVPSQMIFLQNKRAITRAKEDENTKKFLGDINNYKYLRYGHIDRYGNHFRYYLRLAALYRDKKDDIERWLIALKNSDGAAFDTGKKTINILIAPQHFSNTGFVNSVAHCIFGDSAHIIELDIRKEFRSNFKTKYSNYKQLRDYIDENKRFYKLKFYYVNDQIVSGRTFTRAESLISSLLGKVPDKENTGKVFDGVFTLADRNSYESRKAYVNPSVDGSLPFFSYLRFCIPSLRNHDDSCPLCARIKEEIKIVKSSAFTSTAYYWQEKMVRSRQRTVDEARKIDNKLDIESCGDIGRKYRYFSRLQCENDLWMKLYSCVNKDDAYFGIIDAISTRIDFISADLPIARNRDNTKNDFFNFIKTIFILPDDNAPKNEKSAEKYRISPQERYDLFKTVVMQLCTIGSCALLDYERLSECLRVGKVLEVNTNKTSNALSAVEYLISYLKAISRPLLYYREPVKQAAMELLLKILDVIINTVKKDGDAGAKGAKEYYDKTFNGFLLNAIKRLLCYDKGKSKSVYCCEALKPCVSEKFTGKYGDFFRRLYIENNRQSYEECEIRLEGAELFDCATMRKYDEGGKIRDKYRYMSKRLQEICAVDAAERISFYINKGKPEDGKPDTDERKEEKNNNKEIKYTYISGLGNDEYENEVRFAENEDFRVDEENGIYYVKIDNNYSRFGEEQNTKVYEYCDRLGLEQNAQVIIKVKCNDIKILRNILAYRQKILREAERDFNNGTVKKLISTEEIMEAFTRKDYYSHKNDPRDRFVKNVLRHCDSIMALEELKCNYPDSDIRKMKDSLYNSLDSALESYMEPMISIMYKDLIKRYPDEVSVDGAKFNLDNIKKKTYLRSDEFLKRHDELVTAIDAQKAVEFIIKMLEHNIKRKKYAGIKGDEEPIIKLGFCENSSSEPTLWVIGDDTDKISKQQFIEKFKDYIFVGWLIGDDIQQYEEMSERYFEPYMILDALVKNAVRYGNGDIKIIFEKKREKHIDLTVQNGYTDISEHGRGMTLYAFGNYFGTENPQKIKHAPYIPTCLSVSAQLADSQGENGFYSVTIQNYARK